MNIQELKIRLLNLNIFEDNDYLNDYCNLIYNNIKNSKQRYKTQSHHFIPSCYYKNLYNIKGKDYRKKSDEYAKNDPNNFLVNLYFSDHVLAHYYLALCSTDVRFKAQMTTAIQRMGLTDDDLSKLFDEQFQKNYEQLKWIAGKEHSKKTKGNMPTPWNKGGGVYSDELRARLSESHKENPNRYWLGKNHSEETKQKIRNFNLGKKLSEETKKKISNYRKGKTSNTKGKIWITNGINNKVVEEKDLNEWLQKGFYLGIVRKKVKSYIRKKGSASKGRKCIHKNNVYKYVYPEEVENYLKEGWRYGKWDK